MHTISSSTGKMVRAPIPNFEQKGRIMHLPGTEINKFWFFLHNIQIIVQGKVQMEEGHEPKTSLEPLQPIHGFDLIRISAYSLQYNSLQSWLSIFLDYCLRNCHCISWFYKVMICDYVFEAADQSATESPNNRTRKYKRSFSMNARKVVLLFSAL